MKYPYSMLPALPATAGLVGGILLANAGAAAAAIAAGIALWAVLLWRKRHYAGYICLFMAVGAIMSVSKQPPQLPETLYEGKHRYTAKITSVEEKEKSTVYLATLLTADGAGIPHAGCKVTVNTPARQLHAGTEVRFTAAMAPIETTKDVPGETDYNKHLVAEGIVCECWIQRNELTTVKAPGGLAAVTARWRDALYDGIVTSPVSSATASFLAAVILGEGQLLPQDEYYRYRSTGVAHILALSGMHVGIIAVMLAFLLAPMRISRRTSMLRHILTVAVIWVYAMLVGFTPSIVRAAVMITAFTAATCLERGYSTFNSLLLAVAVILCINPGWLFTPGFQLSVSAVASILLYSKLMPQTLRRKPRLYYLVNLVTVPVAAMLGTGVVSAYYFNTFPSMFLLGNIVTGMLLPWILTGGILLMAASMLGMHPALAGKAVDMLYQLMDTLITLIAEKGPQAVGSLNFTGWAILPYYAAVALLALAAYKRKPAYLAYSAAMIAAMAATIEITTPQYPAGELYIPRDASHTRIIVRQGTDSYLWTDSHEAGDVIRQSDRQYRNFLATRRCGDHFKPLAPGLSAPGITYRHPYLLVNGKTICLVTGDMAVKAENLHTHYALVCNGYRGSIADAAQATGADTMLLSADIHPRRRSRYARECQEGGIPCKDLGQKAFSLIADAAETAK